LRLSKSSSATAAANPSATTATASYYKCFGASEVSGLGPTTGSGEVASLEFHIILVSMRRSGLYYETVIEIFG
jgi:hypothetical protein